MAELPKKMTLQAYIIWLGKEESKKVSLPNFFPNGVTRTINVLKGRAKPSSVKRWESFGKRMYGAYKKRPTNRIRYALKNWGFAVYKSKKEKMTLK